MAKPFRFGVQAGTASSAAEWRDKARRIEDLGYSTLFLPDHFVDTQLAPMPALAMAAAHTTTLRVGSLVFGNDYKHPGVLAKEAATIDVLSDGRFELGLGAGWMTADYEALGFALDEAGVRVDRLEEAVQVVKGAWAEGRYDHAGTHYTITGYDGIPAPRQQPRIPVLIGGGGRRVLSLAGREADIVGINPNLRAGVIGVEAAQDSVREMTERKIAWVRDAAGSRFDDLELQIRYFAAAITDDAAGMAETMAPMFGIEPSAALEAGTVLVGTVGQCVETLQRRREEWGVSYVVLGDDQLEAFAPVVAALAGT